MFSLTGEIILDDHENLVFLLYFTIFFINNVIFLLTCIYKMNTTIIFLNTIKAIFIYICILADYCSMFGVSCLCSRERTRTQAVSGHLSSEKPFGEAESEVMWRLLCTNEREGISPAYWAAVFKQGIIVSLFRRWFSCCVYSKLHRVKCLVMKVCMDLPLCAQWGRSHSSG